MPPKKKNEELETIIQVLNCPAEALKESGVPVHKAVFHKAIVSLVDGVPEYAFYSDGANKKSRLAQMWYTPFGLLIEQKTSRKEIKSKLIPLANIVETDLL